MPVKPAILRVFDIVYALADIVPSRALRAGVIKTKLGICA